MPANAARPHLRALTGVRYLAALHVMIFHVAVLWEIVGRESASDGKLFQSWCAAGAALLERFWPLKGIALSGFVAVSFFFTLSGFILAYTSLDSSGAVVLDRRQFWVNRFARVYPVYFLGLVFNFLLFLVWLGGRKPPLSAPQGLAVGGSAILLLQSWWPLAAGAWNPPGWSLSVEAFFYFLFPWLLPIVTRLPARGLVLWLLGAWAAAIAAPIAYLAAGGEVDWLSEGETLVRVIEFNPALRLPEFFAGMVLGRIFLSRNMDAEGAISRSGNGLSLIAAAGLLVALSLSQSLPRLLLYNGLLLPLYLLLIYGLALGGGALAWLLSRRWFVLLGDSSYALYILHHGVIFYGVPIVWLALGGSAEVERQLGGKVASSADAADAERGLEQSNANSQSLRLAHIEPSDNPPTPLGYLTGSALLATLASIAVFKLYEVPARRILRHRLGARRPQTEPEDEAQLP